MGDWLQPVTHFVSPLSLIFPGRIADIDAFNFAELVNRQAAQFAMSIAAGFHASKR